jgi:hypothetical protein
VSEEPSKAEACIGNSCYKDNGEAVFFEAEFNFNKTLSKRAVIDKGGSFRKKNWHEAVAVLFPFKLRQSYRYILLKG